MPFPAPDYFAGAVSTQQLAKVIFGTAGWVRRRCNEILSEPRLDVLKIYDLGQQCRLFREYCDRVMQAGEVTVILEALVQLIREDGVGRPAVTAAEVNADAKALYQAAGVFLTWAQANLLQAGQPIPANMNPEITINRTFDSPDMTVTVTKSAAVTNQVTTLRAALG